MAKLVIITADAARASSPPRSAQRFVSEQRPTTLVIAAGPRLLGAWREAIGDRRWQGLDVRELSEDLSGQPLPKLCDVLTRRGLLPEPRLPRSGVYRPRGQPPQPPARR